MFIISFIITEGYIFYFFFYSGKKYHDLIYVSLSVHNYSSLVIAFILCHIFWLFVQIINLLIHKQFIACLFILLFILLDFCLIKIIGFLWALSMIG